MKAIPALTLAAALMLLAACEHTPPTKIQAPSYAGKQVASAETGNTPGVICTREVPTGLRVAVTKCRDSAEVDKRRELDQEWAKSIPAELPKER
ncbi:hypothetical protein [Rubrivivax rivuli]|uniref:Lipoprotein n=1 Tax=Rubrivivax rivuli TaxID=1862385 RepID=A0A437RCU9_9BURK|nr:hypothetical protein [Rubrivivax rivuli]RVU44576.1 hypothetical protein EOE66_18110 [Rubrivivax rivuli]